MSDLAIELTKLAFKAEPALLECEPGSTARAATAAADLLGCVMATVLKQKGRDTYIKAMTQMFARAHESAIKTIENAERIAQNEPHKTQ